MALEVSWQAADGLGMSRAIASYDYLRQVRDHNVGAMRPQLLRVPRPIPPSSSKWSHAWGCTRTGLRCLRMRSRESRPGVEAGWRT